ncbi:MAG: PHP domain-containing protein [Candidatus Micrarchaeota archaeon]|nr:PHP domain-containing protein [Candidatus Micrarchaeota archaeon]
MNEEKRVFKADLHIHTEYSIDSLSRIEDVLSSAVKKGLSAIAITDHNETAGAIEAQKLAKEKEMELQVIVGEEVATDKGELLVYFVKEKISPGTIEQVLFEVNRQQAVCAAAHPFDVLRKGLNLERLPPSVLSKIDAIEAFNARVILPQQNTQALLFAKKTGKPTIAGSDAHHPSEVGNVYTEFSGISQLDGSSFLSAPRTLCGGSSFPYVHAFSSYAAFSRRVGLVKRRGIK